MSPFEQMKAALRNNLKGLKKEEEKDSELGGPVTIGGATAAVVGLMMIEGGVVRLW